MNYASIVLFVADAALWLHSIDTVLNIVYT